MIKPKTKKVKKWKYSRREGLERLGFLFNMKGEYNAPNEVNGEDVYKIFMATQPQPIKEEDKKEDPKEKTPRDCIVCGKTIYADYDSCINVCNQCANNKQEESKDIELPEFKIAGEYYMQEPPKLLIDWMKQVTDTLNSLTKRNIK